MTAPANETILLVEDEEMLRCTTALVLGKLGYGLRVAADGVEALEVLEAHGDEIRLVISDALMPRLDGLALFRALREAGNTVPFILVTGATERELPANFADPTFHFLSKPWTVPNLARAVREALDAARIQIELP